MASEVAAAATNTVRRAAKEIHGIVVSAGLMDKTVKVKLGGLRWEPRVQKHFKEPRFKLVHDPANSLRQGDVVAITPSWRVSQHVRHVVKHIIAPYGEPIDERPPIPTLEERLAEKTAKKAAKDERRAARREEEEKSRVEQTAAEKARKTLKASSKVMEEVRRTLQAHGIVPPIQPTQDDVD
ncbi:nucleic acid-binding protein [Hypomontagnella monticulosa]|nr:nucleic acid-binding protein [Hypomontagnella monticulosa]